MYWKLSYPIQPDSIHKAKTIVKYFIYKKPDTLQKARQFLLRFYIQKSRHFTLCYSLWIFEVGIFIQKKMTPCVTWRFYIQKARHFAKRKKIWVQKPGHFALREFSLNVWRTSFVSILLVSFSEVTYVWFPSRKLGLFSYQGYIIDCTWTQISWW